VISNVIEMLDDISEIINVGYGLIRAAKDEVPIIFHITNALLPRKSR
jgi:hypothetical protein